MSSAKVVSTSKRSCKVTGLAAGTRYYVQVRGVSRSGKGSWSSRKSFVTAPKAPAAPACAWASDGATGHISASWAGVAAATGYKVVACESSAFDEDCDPVTVSASKASLYKLAPVKHWVRVRAYRVNESGKRIYSPWSKSTAVRATSGGSGSPAAPTNPSAPSDTPGAGHAMTVAFDRNGDTGVVMDGVSAMTCYSAPKASALPALEPAEGATLGNRQHCSFKGWYADAACTQPVTDTLLEQAYGSGADRLTVYAAWNDHRHATGQAYADVSYRVNSCWQCAGSALTLSSTGILYFDYQKLSGPESFVVFTSGSLYTDAGYEDDSAYIYAKNAAGIWEFAKSASCAEHHADGNNTFGVPHMGSYGSVGVYNLPVTVDYCPDCEQVHSHLGRLLDDAVNPVNGMAPMKIKQYHLAPREVPAW